MLWVEIVDFVILWLGSWFYDGSTEVSLARNSFPVLPSGKIEKRVCEY